MKDKILNFIRNELYLDGLMVAVIQLALSVLLVFFFIALLSSEKSSADELHFEVFAPVTYTKHFEEGDWNEKNKTLGGQIIQPNGFQLGAAYFENSYFKNSAVVYGGINRVGYSGEFLSLSYGSNLGIATNYPQTSSGIIPYFTVYGDILAFDKAGLRVHVLNFQAAFAQFYVRF